MKEFKGTQGKWSFSHGSASDDNVACIEINSSESLHEIAYLQSTPSSIGKYEQTSFDKTIANAHLIAAAPDLLEVMQDVIEQWKVEHDEKGEPQPLWVKNGLLAISKALVEE